MKVQDLPLRAVGHTISGQSLSVNQVVTGKVLGILAPGKFLMTVGGHPFAGTARGGTLLPGQTAQFRVTRAGPLPEFTLLGLRHTDALTHSPKGKALVGSESSGSHPPARIQTLLHNKSLISEILNSPRARAIGDRMRARLLSAADLPGKGILRDHFLHSGLFMDRYARQQNSQGIGLFYRPEDDNKRLLLLLADELFIKSSKYNNLHERQAIQAYTLHSMNKAAVPKGFVGQGLEDDAALKGLLGMLAEENLQQVMHNQARSLSAQLSGERAWYFDLPVKLFSEFVTVSVKIAREGDEGSEHPETDEQIWRISFELESRHFGKIAAELEIRGNQVQARVNAERQFALNRLQDNRQSLVAGLKNGGLDLQTLNCDRMENPDG